MYPFHPLFSDHQQVPAGRGLIRSGRATLRLSALGERACCTWRDQDRGFPALRYDTTGEGTGIRSRRSFEVLSPPNAILIAGTGAPSGRSPRRTISGRFRTFRVPRGRPASPLGRPHSVSCGAAGTIDDPLVSSGTMEIRPTALPVPGVSIGRRTPAALRPRMSGGRVPRWPVAVLGAGTALEGSTEGPGPIPVRLA